ncbi:hypothetical protein KSP40_PGU000658 [Platanthera guangdongensis]|uniref:Uncharacterized protein n=1 Tax=Platanthera guangdongensis TaxID=2320717 RepID=A0ABR2LM89_9ASPA
MLAKIVWRDFSNRRDTPCLRDVKKAILKKLENRVHTLKNEVDHCIKMTELIEYNLEDVDATILAVRVALANEMAWDDLARMVKEEKKSGNPIAALIDKLYLERNSIKEAQRKHYRAVRGKSKLCYPGGEEGKCTVAPAHFSRRRRRQQGGFRIGGVALESSSHGGGCRPGGAKVGDDFSERRAADDGIRVRVRDDEGGGIRGFIRE